MRNEPSYKVRTVPVSEARRCLSDYAHDAFGEQKIIGMCRYDQFLAAIVSVDVLRLVAGEELEPEHEKRIRNTARKLLESRRKFR